MIYGLKTFSIIIDVKIYLRCFVFLNLGREYIISIINLNLKTVLYKKCSTELKIPTTMGFYL